MNQHQRKFLLDQIEKQYRKEREILNDREPEAPCLNNFLVAAILAGTVRLQPPEILKEWLGVRVRQSGTDDALISTNRRSWRASRNADEPACVTIPADVVFVLPEDFLEVQRKYEANHKQWESELAALEAAMSALRIKVQVGSDSALAPLIDQADRICHFSLVAAHGLLLGPPPQPV